MNKTNYLVSKFKEWTAIRWEPSIELMAKLEEYISNFSGLSVKNEESLKNSLIFVVNSKLELNKSLVRRFIDEAAKHGIYFNYHEKIKIEESICHPELNFEKLAYRFIKKNEDVRLLAVEVEKNKNKKILNLDGILESDSKKNDVIESIFCSFVYYCFDEIFVHEVNNIDCKKEYKSSFFEHLEVHHSQQINRKNGLSIIDVENIVNNKPTYSESLSNIFTAIEAIYADLDNHSYLALIISDNVKNKWSLISDLTIFCEKFLERELRNSFFKKSLITKVTCDYIPEIDVKSSRFDLANEGFHYKDCYLAYTKNNEEIAVLLFEKNERDERLVPCPKCRSKDVQGNSYPILGLKSWECKNTFCGDKSKYNRGKRYSLSSVIRQQAINDEKNIIPVNILKKWRRDIVENRSYKEIIEFLILCYSLYGDTVKVIGSIHSDGYEIYGRNIKNVELATYQTDENKYFVFKNIAFFKRFIVNKPKSNREIFNLSEISGVELYQGDSFDILSKVKDASISGAVTSPPYYNAKDYSQWENIYCYLYDMYNIALQVYRVLKPGSPFLFNIFDYFDNEKNIVFSAMGKKRMILSAYIGYIFREVGFKYLGNCAWDKGEIQGNRNFNQGNLSPYYQAPHNCWEHIMVFSKGEPSFNCNSIPKKISEKPVFKILNGINTYGHTAPYPKRIPKLLLSVINDKRPYIVLDPFSGSMTTGRAAYQEGINSINIELHGEYCRLSLKMLNDEIKNRFVQVELFEA